MDRAHAEKLITQMRNQGGNLGTAAREALRAEIDMEISAGLASDLAALSGEVSELRQAVTAAATGSSRQADALVRWTKWYVLGTFLLVAVTVFTAWWSRP